MSSFVPVSIKKTVLRYTMFAVLLLGLCYYANENLRPHQVYLRDTKTKAFLSCHRSPKHLRDLVRLVEDTVTIMDSLNITNFLVYGSIWGSYRFQGPLPWDHDADIGIIGDSIYEKNKETFIRHFQMKGIKVRNHWGSVSYQLKRGESAQLGIFVFNDYKGTMQRSGIESWIGFVHYKLYHTFPSWMIQTPLPTMKFGWLDCHVPRGGRKILKHLYPFDWRRQFLPTDCKRNNITEENLAKFMREKVNKAGRE